MYRKHYSLNCGDVSENLRCFLVALVAAVVSPGLLHAGSIYVANGSFEAPSTVFVDNRVASWQKSPKPAWYDETANGPWEQLTGVFLNTPPDSTNNDHIANLDGSQAAFLFALPGVALFQDNVTSSNAFGVNYEAGKSYQLTVGVLGNGGGMATGATLQIGLYYLDATSNQITVCSATITNSSALFPARTNLVDFQAQLPLVKPADAWAGKNIGIQIFSTTGFSLAGGYWDVDNVRLISFQGPVLSGSAGSNGGFNLSLRSEPGLKFEIMASSEAITSGSNWVSLGTLTNTTGQTTFLDLASGLSRRFYQARQVP